MNLKTEAANPNTANLDKMSNLDLVETFIGEDKQVLEAIKQAKEEIAKAIELVHEALSSHGRLFYFGSGTSGRLGVLDASECPPTFSVDPEMVQGVIAGGDRALREAIEGAEDNEEAGYKYVEENLKQNDIVVGISASGSTPFVIGALKAAKHIGLKNIAISNNPISQIAELANHHIFLDTGAEVLSGSTRLKAGTAQKMVLNIISTSVMVKLGKVYGNLMVDLNASNAKLVKRATNLVQVITNCSETEAQKALENTDHKVKNAVLYILKGLNLAETKALLEKNNGFLSAAIED